MPESAFSALPRQFVYEFLSKDDVPSQASVQSELIFGSATDRAGPGSAYNLGDFISGRYYRLPPVALLSTKSSNPFARVAQLMFVRSYATHRQPILQDTPEIGRLFYCRLTDMADATKKRGY